MQIMNAQLDTNQLPSTEEIDWQPVDRRYLIVLRLVWGIVSAACLAILGLISYLIYVRVEGVWIYWAVLILLLMLWFFLQEKSFRYRAYAVREKDILYRHGWIIHSIQACPINRIQHCSLRSGPLERRHGLASVTLYTAGGGSSDLRISGLPDQTATDIREFIMKKIGTGEEHADRLD